MMNVEDLKRNWRIWLMVVVVALSVTLIATKGLSYGIDFIGGTELKMELEMGGDTYIESTTRILKERLNGLGLKSIQVLPEADKKHITIKVSTTDPAGIEDVKNILNQQAIFEQYVEGELCARGEEIQLDITAQGGATVVSGDTWQVYIRTSGDAPARCGLAMKEKAGHMTDVFLDRPSDSIILLDNEVCKELDSVGFINNRDDAGYTQLSFIEERANIPVVCYISGETPEQTSIEEELGVVFESNESNETSGNQTSEEVSNENAVQELQELWETKNKTRIILMVNESFLPEEIQDKIGELNITVNIVPKSPEQPYHSQDAPNSWIDKVTGLKSTLSIQEGLTYGNPIFNSIFTGTAGSQEEAREIVQAYEIWLTSGNLPTKINIVLEKPNLPELGQQFLKSSAIIAIIAILLVSIIITIRYREPKISAFVVGVGFSEIVIILGFASLVSWELDLAALAGIIAAVGTGVDSQIVITDETLRGERRREDKKVWDVKVAIGRAFFIIFTAGFTTIGAMLPLMSIIDLKGFAFTTIVGVLIGILITRPAYARIAELIT